jgi:hypothetical protein
VLQRIKQWREQRGSLPGGLRDELEAEGMVLVEERIRASIIFRGYQVPGQRPRSGHQTARVSIALTERRLVVHGTGSTHLEVPRGADWLRVELRAPDRLILAYDAEAAQPNRSGDVELELETPRAEAIHATLTGWMRTPSS